MPLVQPLDSHLPHIDAAPAASALGSANALIEAELDVPSQAGLHPSIPSLREPQFSAAVEAEHARLAQGLPKPSGDSIDLSRYEALDAPADGSDAEAWRAALRKAYAAHEYLRSREMNLGLLETYGKNAWLVGNARLEDELKAAEREVEAAKVEKEEVEQARRAVQGNARAEMEMLGAQWREGVGRMVETQAAGEGLKVKILEAKRLGAS
ncbi:hypothetical protein K431DRAFT_126395 [Polychaeton citri CBS 116435]|uniref:Pre-mRNA-splicing factor SPF27 n=1 Tax=Polychaeton citri CBS 116435 TaxID=1314669 RepID=A0A9P4Q5L6_9PEZI|nr:hypothetical protein K431DRAFT_126395 [Polychaeton citri CBS 116435]